MCSPFLYQCYRRFKCDNIGSRRVDTQHHGFLSIAVPFLFSHLTIQSARATSNINGSRSPPDSASLLNIFVFS